MGEVKGLPRLFRWIFKRYPDVYRIYSNNMKFINFVIVDIVGYYLSLYVSNRSSIPLIIYHIIWLYVMIFVLGSYFGFDIQYEVVFETQKRGRGLRRYKDRDKEEKRKFKLPTQVIDVGLAVVGLLMLISTSYFTDMANVQLGFALGGVALLVYGIQGFQGKDKSEEDDIH